MKKIVSFAVISMAALSFNATASEAAGDAEAGKASYAMCGGCHGATGAGMPAAGYPKLSGQTEAYIYEQLMAFKNGTRVNATMNAMAATLATEADVRNVSAYIATLK